MPVTPQTFSFVAGGRFTRVELDGEQLTIVRGTAQSGRSIPLSELRGLYVIVEPTLRRQVLLLAWGAKIERLRAGTGDTGELDALADTLASLRPGLDLRALPVKEGLRKLGAGDRAVFRYGLVPVVGMLAMALGTPELLMMARPVLAVSARELPALPETWQRYQIDGHARVEDKLDVSWKTIGASGHKAWLVPLGDASPALFLLVDDSQLARVANEPIHQASTTRHVDLEEDVHQKHGYRTRVVDDGGYRTDELAKLGAIALALMAAAFFAVRKLNGARRPKPKS